MTKNQFDFEPIGSPPGLILEIEEQGVLLNRIGHHIVRSHGLCLPLTFVQNFCPCLLEYYLTRTSYREALDVANKLADIAINKASSQEMIFHELKIVCDVIEAKGTFLHAAEVYLEMITVFGATKNVEFCCLIFAGIAF